MAEPTRFFHPDEYRQGTGFTVLADRRVFAVMAFLNAVGYDEEYEGKSMHPVRVRVRKMVEAKLTACPKKLQAWREYYRRKGMGIFVYQDFALSLCTDYPFKRIRPNNESVYPWAIGKLSDFPSVLNEFWNAADLSNVWNEIKGDYISEIQKYDFKVMERQLCFLWEYLKMKRSDTSVIVNIPDLLNKHYFGIGAHYENYYYCVESPGSHSYGLNIHEYLHSIVNPIVWSNYRTYDRKLQQYYLAGKTGRMSATYQEPFTFAAECLVRALDSRIRVLLAGNDPSISQQLEGNVTYQTSEGLTLTKPFYLLLKEYESSTLSFKESMLIMLSKLPEYVPGTNSKDKAPSHPPPAPTAKQVQIHNERDPRSSALSRPMGIRMWIPPYPRFA